mgnify:CR=1 FL=1
MKKLLLFMLAIILLSCSQENELNEDTEIKKILNSDSTFTIEDFKKIGFKINKGYDVTDLDESTGAWFGFWKNNLDKPIDYELRFYPSQQTAIDIGVSLTEEVIGENAVLKKSISSWKEGIQDRRSRNNSSMSGSEANSVRAKYLDYFINGNVIISVSYTHLTLPTSR